MARSSSGLSRLGRLSLARSFSAVRSSDGRSGGFIFHAVTQQLASLPPSLPPFLSGEFRDLSLSVLSDVKPLSAISTFQFQAGTKSRTTYHVKDDSNGMAKLYPIKCKVIKTVLMTDQSSRSKKLKIIKYPYENCREYAPLLAGSSWTAIYERDFTPRKVTTVEK